MRHFLNDLADHGFAGADRVFGWSAYSQGSGDNRTANADAFIVEALTFFGYTGPAIIDAVERGRKLADLVGGERALLILDGLEPLQDLPHVNGGRLKERGLAALITALAARNRGLLLITSRQAFPELEAHHTPRVICHALDRLDRESGVKLYRELKTDPDVKVKSIPVIIQSGIAEKSFLRSQKALTEFGGAAVPEPEAYLEKPVEAEELAATIRNVLGEK